MRRRQLVATGLPWLVAVLVVAALAVGIGAAGGWAAAPDDRGRRVEVAETVTLARWEVAALEAAVIDIDPDGVELSPRLRVTVRLTNLTDETLDAPTNRVLAFDRPAGLAEVDPRTENVSGYGHTSTDVDAGATATIAYDFVPDDQPVEVTEVVVRLYDEAESEGLLFGGWADSRPAGHVLLAVEDRR